MLHHKNLSPFWCVLLVVLSLHAYPQAWVKDTVLSFYGVETELEVHDEWIFASVPDVDFGKVIVFRMNTYDDWEMAQELSPNIEGEPYETWFGQSIDCNGEYLVVGAGHYSETEYLAGAVYVYRLVEGIWTEWQRIEAVEPYARDYFGSSLSISDNVLVIGAFGYGTDYLITEPNIGTTFYEYQHGAAFVYRLVDDEWQFEQRLCPCGSGQVNDWDGRILASNDSTIVMSGSYNRQFRIFQNQESHWQEIDLLDVPHVNWCFSRTPNVVLTDKEMILTASGRTCNFYEDAPDLAYWYSSTPSGYVKTGELTSFDTTIIRGLGHSISEHNGTLAIGATTDSVVPELCGSVYLYEMCEGPWDEIQVIQAESNACTFGKSLALHNRFLAISETVDDSSGFVRIHVYQKNEGYTPSDIDDFKVYPNPASSSIIIESDNGMLPPNLDILDVNGKLVRSESRCCYGSRSVVGFNLSPGVYFIRVYSETSSVTKKLVVVD